MKKIKIISKLSILFVILLILNACQTNAESYPIDYEQLGENERIVIRFSHVVGEDTPKGMAARKFAELIKQRSNGFIEVQIFSNGKLYKDGEEMDALQRGDVQMIAPATSKLTKLVPEISIYDLPFAFRSFDDIHNYSKSPAGHRLVEKLEVHNLIAFSIWDSGFKQLSNNVRPITHYSDLKGLQMRIMPSDILHKQFTTVGGSTKLIDFNNVFNELQNSSIDGQENTLSNFTSKSMYTLQNHLTISNHGYLGYFVLFNLEFWNSLPTDVKLLIYEVLEEVEQWEWEVAEKLNIEKLNEIEKCQCIDIEYLDEASMEEWEKEMLPVYDYYRAKYSNYYLNSLPKFKN
ncbi:DctP family TRAP transporter solute-binding subunit [Solibacillus sp. FSL K6-1523]|uniref:DctP family TRAP transporter solute-binding subunit n=1 Tax=Solibacillus sp. FSL K6-1523 TaxID=2921471 RepID=UPI0030F900F3